MSLTEGLQLAGLMIAAACVGLPIGLIVFRNQTPKPITPGGPAPRDGDRTRVGFLLIGAGAGLFVLIGVGLLIVTPESAHQRLVGCSSILMGAFIALAGLVIRKRRA